MNHITRRLTVLKREVLIGRFYEMFLHLIYGFAGNTFFEGKLTLVRILRVDSI